MSVVIDAGRASSLAVPAADAAAAEDVDQRPFQPAGRVMKSGAGSFAGSCSMAI